MGITYLTGQAKERASVGKEVIENLYKETKLKETLNKADEALKILELIKSKKENCDIDDVIDIIMYAKSYTANVKDWKDA